jgi:hypothetical protein
LSLSRRSQTSILTPRGQFDTRFVFMGLASLIIVFAVADD